jgi:hypothetical protein
MHAPGGLALLLVLLAGCADVQMLGATGIEQRRVMNDMQARGTLAAVCDISLGAYLRELNAMERHFAGLVCGADPGLPEQLVSP